MDANQSLANLAKCLDEAGKIVSQLAFNPQRNPSSRSLSAATTSAGSSSWSSSAQLPLEAAISAVGRTVNRANSMVQKSSNTGLFSRINKRERLRAMSGNDPMPKKTKPVEKTFEFVLFNGRQLEENENYLMEDESVVLRGIVTLNSQMREKDIRECLTAAIKLKFPSVAPQDLEFLKAIRRKLSRPVNTGEFSFKEVKLLAGQGCIYVRMKDGFECLLEEAPCEIIEETTQEPQNSHEEPHGHQEKEEKTQDIQQESQNNQQTQENPQEQDDSYLYKPTWDKKSKVDVAVVDEECLATLKRDNIVNPIEILRCFQKYIIQGRPLDTISTESTVEEQAICIDINRYKLLETTFQELEEINNLRLTLKVAFYGEIAHDNGGPRKEFFTLCLREIKEKYFDKGLRELLSDDYEKIGIILALSIIQNGPVPRFLQESILQELFEAPDPSPCISKLRLSFTKLGLYQIGKAVPIFIHLMRPSPSYELTRRKLINLLKPTFSEEGSNARINEMKTYELFLKYVREAASGRREGIALGNILQFATGIDEDPPLGFAIPPSIQFSVGTITSKWSFIPTANTCTQTIYLPRESFGCPLPSEDDLFELYDSAFKNAYFGLA